MGKSLIIIIAQTLPAEIPEAPGKYGRLAIYEGAVLHVCFMYDIYESHINY